MRFHLDGQPVAELARRKGCPRTRSTTIRVSRGWTWARRFVARRPRRTGRLCPGGTRRLTRSATLHHGTFPPISLNIIAALPRCATGHPAYIWSGADHRTRLLPPRERCHP